MSIDNPQTPVLVAARALFQFENAYLGWEWDDAGPDEWAAYGRRALLVLEAAIGALSHDVLFRCVKRQGPEPVEYERIMDSSASIEEASTALFERDRAALRRAFGL